MTSSSVRSTSRLALTAALVLGMSLAQAGGFAEDFDSGLDGWSSAGDVSVMELSGYRFAALGTASLDGADDAPYPAGALNFSGKPLAAANLTDGLEAAAGLALGALNLDATRLATEGSVLKRSFQVQAGQTLSFDWLLATNDQGPDFGLDLAFVVVDGQLIGLARASQAGGNDVPPFQRDTGIRQFEYRFQRSGEIGVAFGVADVGDTLASSMLAIDNVSISPVPESQTSVLLLAGLAGLLGWARRRTSVGVRKC